MATLIRSVTEGVLASGAADLQGDGGLAPPPSAYDEALLSIAGELDGLIIGKKRR